ncbi:CMRF35-like molecule 9 [Clinocottus analis]|uniref:CMRF35-like molecule 9 n=1 Tax=Clinocottus analis TaxID=304258 RepID=UPI0035C18FC4
MGPTWISWRTTTTVIVAILQIQALISVKTPAVTGVEGPRFDFRCKYEDGQQNNTKFFCYDSDDKIVSLIRTQSHEQWHKDGRFSLYDNTTGAFFIVRSDNRTSEDSGMYRCGVDVDLHPDHDSFIQLNVSKGTVSNPPDNLTHQITASTIFPEDVPLNKFHLSLFVTAAMFMAAMLFICLFTLCLRLAVKHRRPSPPQNRETSSDYETMMPGVMTESEVGCSSLASDCADLPTSPPPPDLWSHFTSKHRESTATLGLGDYDEVDGPKYIDQYQHLDLSRIEEHVYHNLKRLSGAKDGPLGVKEQINC